MVAYAKEPSRHAAPLSTVAGCTAPYVEEDVLRNLLGGSLVSQKAHRQRIHRVGVPVIECLQRISISIRYQAEQLAVVSIILNHETRLNRLRPIISPRQLNIRA